VSGTVVATEAISKAKISRSVPQLRRLHVLTVSDHVLGLIGALVSVAAFLGSICGVFLRWLLRVEHRFTRLEQEVFGREETAT
jgi:hypothetical protein